MRRKLFIEPLDSRICLAFGDIDPGFGDGGEYRTSYALTADGNEQIVESFELDGGMLLVVNATSGPGHLITLVKKDGRGLNDPAFGDGGKAYVVDPTTPTREFIRAYQLRTGTILLENAGAPGTYSLMAVHPDGTLNTEFGDDGFLRFDYDYQAGPWHLEPALDGGFFQLLERQFTHRLTKFDGNGKIDTNFGTNGTVTLPRLFGPDFTVADTGQITVAGLETTNGAFYLKLYRLLANGTPDETFGAGGINISADPVPWNHVHVTPDGNSVFSFGGVERTSDGIVYGIQKHTASAQLDLSYGDEGTAYVESSTSDSPSYMQLLLDEQGTAYLNLARSGYEQGNFVSTETFKLLPNGQLDESYASEGVSLQKFPMHGSLNGVRLDDEGNLYWLGTKYDNIDRGALAIKLLADGTLDQQWGAGGVLVEDFTVPGQTIERLELQPLSGGQMRVVSGWPAYETPQANIGRAVTLDPTGTAIQTLPFGTPEGRFGIVTAPSVDGGWFTAQIGWNHESDFITLRKFKSDGMLDWAFGVDGKLIIETEQTTNLFMRAARDGSIVVASNSYGTSADPENNLGLAVVVRLKADGQLDDRFGAGGVLRLHQPPGVLIDALHDAALGTVLVFSDNQDGHTKIQVLEPAGTSRTSFGSGGLFQIDRSLNWKTAEIDEQGRIVAAVTEDFVQYDRLHLLQIDPRGELSSTFGDGGQVTLPIDYNRPFESIELAVRHGLIVVAASHQFEDAKIRLIALDYAGQLLTELGGSGTRDYDLASHGETVQDLEFADDGSLWLAAKAREQLDMTGVVLRLAGSERPTQHNWDNAFDVSGDGFVSPIDALYIINALNGLEPTASGFPDVSGDTYVSPLDALLVINRLNSQAISGEGEPLIPIIPSSDSPHQHDIVFTDGYLADIEAVRKPKAVRSTTAELQHSPGPPESL